MSISRFFDRNRPIFTIGALMAMVFIAIIILYKFKPKQETKLKEVNEMDQQFYRVAYEEPEPENEASQYMDAENQPTDKDVNEQDENSQINIDEEYGVLQINFTENGFEPRINTAVLGQMVSWTNNTDKTIYFKQRKPTYPELKDPIEIKSGESFNFRMTDLGIWTYEEGDSKEFGSVEVKETRIIPPTKNKETETVESPSNP